MKRPLIVFQLVLLLCIRPCVAEHSQVLVIAADRTAISEKLANASWAKAAYSRLRVSLDPIVERTQADPQFAVSRLFMNWDTHYVTPVVEKSRSVGGEGRAAIPTPRFAGARNWATDYTRPPKFQDWKPLNDQAGKVFLLNSKTGRMEWVDPGITGRNFEIGNEYVMSLAADAAFVYWRDGDAWLIGSTAPLTISLPFASAADHTLLAGDRPVAGAVWKSSGTQRLATFELPASSGGPVQITAH